MKFKIVNFAYKKLVEARESLRRRREAVLHSSPWQTAPNLTTFVSNLETNGFMVPDLATSGDSSPGSSVSSVSTTNRM